MSDVEEVQVEEVAVESTQPSELSLEDALKSALSIALRHNGLARGLKSASKALTTRNAVMCVLCDSVTEESYIKLVEGLCSEGNVNIPLIKVSDAKKLGEWVGLAQLDREGNPRKIVGCGVAVITNWGEDSAARQALLKHFETL